MSIRERFVSVVREIWEIKWAMLVSLISVVIIFGVGYLYGYERGELSQDISPAKEITSVEPRTFQVEDLKPVSFLQEGESYLQRKDDGQELQARAKKLGADLGKQDGEYILKNSDKIPESFRGKTIIFPGTLLEDREGFRGFWSLSWIGKDRKGKDRWTAALLWANREWWGEYVLAQPPPVK